MNKSEALGLVYKIIMHVFLSINMFNVCCYHHNNTKIYSK